MTESKISLAPPDDLKPRKAHIPFERALRWRARLEDENHLPAVSVFISQRAFVRFCAHAGSDLDNEVGGWLVGKWRADKETGEQFIIVEATLPARHIRHGGTFLTFTQDSQVTLYAEFQERFPNKELVGWYHTHPRMGIFLSEYDTWLHRNFFPEPYQVALVIEPFSSTGGFFIRQRDGTLNPHHYFGFYELNNRGNRSVVHWRNLSPETEILSVQGDNP
ncbi:MAG: Mov34/MPN/PAD-1 family protein [Anaerolineales bacterium]|nr:Mov34/MPN/PAD-1 family protein [Anaerolineales bacterium]